MHIILRTPSFNQGFNKIIPKNLQGDIERRILKLSVNPHNGKPLGNSLWELKAGKFRIYYIIFESEILVLMVDVSDKKHQQETINSLKKTDFKKIIENYKNPDK